MPLTALSPDPGDYGVTAPHSRPVAAEGPGRAGRPESMGPFCFSSSSPLASAPGDLHGQGPWDIPLLPRRPGFCPSASTAPGGRGLYREHSAPARGSGARRKHQGPPGPSPAPTPALSPSCLLLLPGCPCTWVRRGQFRLQHGLCEAGQYPGQRMPRAPFDWLTAVAGDPKRRDTAQAAAAQPGSPSVTRNPRTPPASGRDAYTSGGWAVPAPLTSPRTGQAQGGPGAEPGPAEGAEDT